MDASDTRTSNWLRWVNCATTIDNENLAVRICNNHVHYIASRDIAPGEELMVWYGYHYAHALGVDILPFYLKAKFPLQHRNLYVNKIYEDFVLNMLVHS